MWFCQKLHPPVLKTSVYEGLLIRRLDTLKKKAIFKGDDLRLCAEAQLKINKDYSELLAPKKMELEVSIAGPI